MKGIRKVIVISENKNLYKSFKRALTIISGVEVSHRETCDQLLTSSENKTACLIIDAILKQNMKRCPVVLRTNMLGYPIINLISYQEKIGFVDSGLFYIVVPFYLDDLLDKINYSDPITNEEIIMFIISWLSKESHDIRNMLNNIEGKNKCVALINQVFESLNESLKLPQQIIAEKESVLKIVLDLSTGRDVIANNIMGLFQNLKTYIESKGKV